MAITTSSCSLTPAGDQDALSCEFRRIGAAIFDLHGVGIEEGGGATSDLAAIMIDAGARVHPGRLFDQPAHYPRQ